MSYIEDALQAPLGTIALQYGFDSTGKAVTSPPSVSNQVAVQLGNPNSNPPATIPAPVIGDVVVQTSDGTATGQLQASYVWSGTAWVMQSAYTMPTALASPSVRTYFTATTAFVDQFPVAETAASIAARGFTAVGTGAALTPAANIANSFGIGLTTTTSAQNATTIAAIYTPPTVYVRHELAVTADVANSYGLKVRSGISDYVFDVWVCDPVSGVPVERLHGTAASRLTSADAGTAFSLAPTESHGAWNREHEWINFLIPASVVAARKTATNTIKLAVKNGIAHGALNNAVITGYSMAACGNSLFAGTPIFTMDNQQNGGAQLTYSSIITGNPYATIAASTVYPAGAPTVGVRIAIPDITRDCYLSAISQGNLYSYVMRAVRITLLSASGNVALDRPRPHQAGPLITALCNSSGLATMSASGWLIPASVLSAKAFKPAGSAVYYVDIQLQNMDDTVEYCAGFFTETV